MNSKQKIKLVAALVIFFAIIIVAGIFFSRVNVDVLNPQGIIASQQKGLLIFTIVLSAIIVIPVFVLLGVFAWKYRETNPKKADYAPDWDSSRLFETIWWGIPCIIILILGIITWQTSHQLDPYKALDSNVTPLRVQVVALQWKWLFIYPDQHVASVNLLEIPEKTPINFTITSDAPMNAFWIPSLGSQVYAMSGMSTQLHLMADKTGDYEGSSSNISGKDFAAMAFTARAVSTADFDTWVNEAKMGASLTAASYKQLAKPGTVKQPVAYNLVDEALYQSIIDKYMGPAKKTNESAKTENTTDMDMNMQGMDMESMH